MHEAGENAVLLRLALVVTSAAIWCAVWFANMYLLSFTQVAPGINLIFLPAGFRLLIVIVFGVWGALGIFLVDPLLFMAVFGDGSLGDVLVNAAISGFAPYLTVQAFIRLAGVQRSLAQLKPAHLPLLALAVSVVTPLLFNLHFIAMGRESPDGFAHSFTAMMTGDFLGCLLVSALARLGIAVSRAAFQRS